MWRYRELLPVGSSIDPVTLDEPCSPLLACPRLARRLGLRNVLVKDDSRLPTASFKARGLSMAVTMAGHFGQRRLAMASNGNAACALAAYAAAAGGESVVVMPQDCNPASLFECQVHGAHLFQANGLIDECGKLVRRGHDQQLWFDVSTLKEPYRLEGKKTMGLEIAEQLGWEFPDAILVPTGGGTALIAIWKAFLELREMQWLRGTTVPRMIAVQSTGCPPIVTAFERGERFSTRPAHAATAAYGIRVPHPLGDFMILDAVRASGGTAIAVDESSVAAMQASAGSDEGASIGLETAATLLAIPQLLASGKLSPDERVVVINTSSTSKYWRTDPLPVPRIDLQNPPEPRSLLDRAASAGRAPTARGR